MKALLLALALAVPAAAWAASPEPRTIDFEQLKALARVNDPRVKALQAEVSRMRGLQSEADAARYPTISTFTAAGAPVPEAINNPNQIDSVTEASRLGNWNFGRWGGLLHFDAQVAQPLYTFGKIANYRAAARNGVEATEQLVKAAQDQAERDACEVFWGFQLARELLSGLDSAMEQIADSRKKIESLLAQKSPQVSRTDLDKLDVLRAELRSRRGEAVSGRDVALEAARLVSGEPDGPPVTLAFVGLAELPMKLLPIERYLEVAKQNRPEIAAARAAVKARQALVEEKFSEFYPNLALVGSVNANWSNAATRQTNPFAYDPYNGKIGGLGLGLQWTFDIPQKQAKLEQARADLERAQADELLATSGVRLQIYQTFGALSAVLDRTAMLMEERDAARRWATSAMLGFDSGMGEVQEVLVASLALARAESELLFSYRDARVRLSDLSRAVGADAAQVK